MDDLFLWAFGIIVFLSIVCSIIGFTADKIREAKEKSIKAEEAKIATIKAKIKLEGEKEIARYKELNQQLEKKIKNSITDYASAKAELKNIATHEIRDKFFLPTKKLLDKEYNLNEMYLSSANGRLGEALTSNLEISDYSLSATIKTANPFLPTYQTSLRKCNCRDFSPGTPCKHIIFLAYTHGILQTNQENCKNHKDSLIEEVAELSKRRNSTQAYIDKLLANAEQGEKYVKKLRKESVSLQNKIENLKATINEDTEIIRSYAESFAKDITEYIKEISNNSNVLSNITYISKVLSEYQALHYQVAYNYLLNKTRPAESAAETVKELKRETKKYLEELNINKLKLAYIESLFPNINDIFEQGFNESDDFELETEENTDRVRLFLSPEEYKKLSTTEKNQLALDRYVENRKSKWQIGRDYEMFIGNKLESEGFKVSYTGIIEKLEDMGRDLIATKGKEVYIIQCKNWSQEKTIHEKHIFQLYGTVVLWKLDNPLSDVHGAFVTSTKLSEKAKMVAAELGIEITENLPLGDFPRIKCNINRTTGEKIYHLPFDQQYDAAVIDTKKGECYAFTVAEAEAKGFRRAWRHFS